VIAVEVVAPDNALKVTELTLGVSVPPLLDVPFVKETEMVPVMAEFAVEVRVTVAVYVWPSCNPAVSKTERFRTVGVVDVPLTLSQPPGVGALAYTICVVNVISVPPLTAGYPVELLTVTCVVTFTFGSVTG
jgi:hypothetical protein